MTHIILLNGPAGVGKDTAADAMVSKWPTWQKSMISETIKLATLDRFGIDRSLLTVYDQPGVKDMPLDEFGYHNDGSVTSVGAPPMPWSFRQAVIDTGNDMRKDDPYAVAKAWAEEFKPLIAIGLPVAIVTDCRLFEEFIVACDLVGGANVYLMRIFRPGHTFENDVGGYIRTDMAVFGNSEVSVVNDMDEDYFKLETTVFAHGFVARRQPKVKL